MANVFNLLSEETFAEKMDRQNTLLAVIASKNGDPGIDSWYAVQQAVRMGAAPTLFPIGTQLKCTHAKYGDIIWDVVAHDYNVDPNNRYAHSMTLLTHDCVMNSLQYDKPEALYFCEKELAAGTYHFSLLAGYDVENGGGKTLQFTLAQPVPANGVITFSWSSQTQSTNGKIATYASADAASAIESDIAVTEGAGGTDLGTADGKVANMNHTQRVRFGSNNWKESAIRQLLNSDAAAGSVWTAQTRFDRPPSWAATQAGWMNGLDPQFCEVVGTARLINRSNNIYEVDGNAAQNYYTDDKFWLASRSEVFGDSESDLFDGTLFPFYDGATSADRVKYNKSGSASAWWLRSPIQSGNTNVRTVNANGSLTNNIANNSGSVAVACAIF